MTRGDSTSDARWMGAALALAERGRGRTAPNPNVGCVIVRDGVVVGRGWTQPGGRPHAEAMALAAGGRGGARGDRLRHAGALRASSRRAGRPARTCWSPRAWRASSRRCAIPIRAPTARGWRGCAAAGIAVDDRRPRGRGAAIDGGVPDAAALGRPFVTLKLATSLDGCIALASGESRWITGPEARAHAHLERSRHEAILVGRGTWEADAPALDVRLAGLEARSPVRVVLVHRPSCRTRPGIRRAARIACARDGSRLKAEGDGVMWITAPDADRHPSRRSPPGRRRRADRRGVPRAPTWSTACCSTARRS